MIDVSPEIVEQNLWRSEVVGGFFSTIVSVVTLAALVVVAQNAPPIDDQRQAILELVMTPGKG